MYKILLLTRDSTIQPLYTPFKISEVVEGVETWVDFATDDMAVLEATIKDLLVTRPQNTIKAIMDMGYVIDIVVNPT